MKLTNQICRFLVGGLFIFSGFIKLNDPYGFSYKLKEYFEVFANDFGSFFHAFSPYALEIAFFICVTEIVLGVAVLVYYRMRVVSWVLLSMIAFFTFLTFYSAYFDKVKECGCFGDFISLTPWESFWKDIFLLSMILVLFFQRKKLNAGFNNLKGSILVGLSAVICIYAGYYSLAHLPYFDWRPYAVGKNIQAQMQPEEEPEFIYVMEKAGKQVELAAYPTDTSYKYIDYKVLNPEKSQPKIMDYRIWNDEGDFTDSSFQGKVLFLIVRDAEKALFSEDSRNQAEKVSKQLESIHKMGIKPMVITASSTESIEDFRHEVQLAAPYYFMDDTQIKTMIRSNLGLMLLENGTIKGKWHQNDIPEFKELKNLVD